MGAVKEFMNDAIESVFASPSVEIEGDKVWSSEIVFETILAQLDGDDDFFRAQESSFWETYNGDTADFLTDWNGRFSAAIAIYTGLATTEDGCIGNYIDLLAYSYHHTPRHVARALRTFGLTEKASQAIIYLLAGRLLEGSDLHVVRFDYLKK